MGSPSLPYTLYATRLNAQTHVTHLVTPLINRGQYAWRSVKEIERSNAVGRSVWSVKK